METPDLRPPPTGENAVVGDGTLVEPNVCVGFRYHQDCGPARVGKHGILHRNIVTVLLLAAGTGRGADREAPLQAPPLSPEYARQRQLILPSPHEQSYRKIDWRTSVLRGVVDAQKKDRPVMIVLMNGHPLGCT